MAKVPVADEAQIKYMTELFCLDNFGNLRFNPNRPRSHFISSSGYTIFMSKFGGQRAGSTAKGYRDARVGFCYNGKQVSRRVQWVIDYIKGKCDVIQITNATNVASEIDYSDFRNVFKLMHKSLS